MLNRKINIFVNPLAAVCMLMLSACSTDDALPVPDTPEKTPIELKVGIVGDGSSATRAVVTDDKASNLALAFAKGTSLYMVMKSESNAGGSTPALYARTIGYAQETVDANNTSVKFATDYRRFWEDSYSRDAKLSVYAACVPGYYLSGTNYAGVTPNGTADGTTWSIGGSTVYDNSWNAGYGTTTIAWPLRSASVTHQTASFIASQDLCFSNNVSDIAHQADASKADNRMYFITGDKKFSSGRLVFYHALTRITFKIKIGEGFGESDNFEFSNSTDANPENIVLKGFNTSGTFNFATGEFLTSPAIGTGDILSLNVTEDNRATSGEFAYVLDGIMLPGTDLNNNDADKIYFTIDNNKYHLKKSDLMAALAGQVTNKTGTAALTDDHKMRPGVNYIFTMTVGKKKMDNLTAAVVDWETVESSTVTPSNARIEVNLLVYDDHHTLKTGSPADFSLYRSTETTLTINDSYESYEWKTGYAETENKAVLNEKTADSGVYTAYTDNTFTTAWYWPDNKTFYHFRTAQPKTVTLHQDATDGDYMELTSAAVYTDVCWGAPFKNTTGKLTYSTTTGFDNTSGSTHQISKAIGPTESNINIEMFHMMSDVTIKLTTTTDADHVDLNGATISLTNIYPTAKVRMGTGVVEPTGTPATVAPTMTYNSTNNVSKVEYYGFVPQSLDNVVLTITTADHNQYILDMDDMVCNSFTNYHIANPYTSAGNKIDRWYPNFKYVYTFNLTKTGISRITATLAEWETVTATNDNVQIK